MAHSPHGPHQCACSNSAGSQATIGKHFTAASTLSSVLKISDMHAFSNRTRFRTCARFSLSSVQRAPRVVDDKKIEDHQSKA